MSQSMTNRIASFPFETWLKYKHEFIKNTLLYIWKFKRSLQGGLYKGKITNCTVTETRTKPFNRQN